VLQRTFRGEESYERNYRDQFERLEECVRRFSISGRSDDGLVGTDLQDVIEFQRKQRDGPKWISDPGI
jgi:hypothetical protein